MPLRYHQAVHGILHVLREVPESQRRQVLQSVFRGYGPDGRFVGWPDEVQLSMCRVDCPCPDRQTCDGCALRHA